MVDWKVRASKVRKSLRAARRGEKELALLQLAGDNNVNTLRREVFALEFLDEVRKTNPSLRKELNWLSFSIVELLARWRSFDKAAALKAAGEAAKGHHNVTSLRKAVAEAKQGSDSLPYKVTIKDAAIDAIRDILDGDVAQDEVNAKDSIDGSLDFKYLRMTRSPPRFETVAALIVGPYKDSALYRQRRRDWLFRAFGLCWFYNHVFLLLPQEAELKSYREWVSDARERAGRARLDAGKEELGRWSPNVHVVCPDPWRHSTISDEEAELLRNLDPDVGPARP